MRLSKHCALSLLPAVLVLALICLIPFSVAASPEEEQPIVLASELKGWDYFFYLMVAQGVEPAYLRNLLQDPRMPEASPLNFKVTPREPASIYRGLNTRANRKNALGFYQENREVFSKTLSDFGVAPPIVLALLQIETGCGVNTGREMVFYRLARLSSANAPSNVERSFIINQKLLKLVSFETVRDRAWYLQELFLKHAVAALELSKFYQISPLDLKGSSAGALGMPQFLPGNVRKYGIDANNDGLVDLFSGPDAILSVANFLKSYGWNDSKPMTIVERKEVLRNYNRSEPYVSLALSMAEDLSEK